MDGIQHFEPIAFAASADADKEMQKNKARDKRKQDWCIKQSIPLLRIGYNVKKEHYASCITDFIQRLNTLEPRTYFAQFIGKQGMYESVNL